MEEKENSSEDIKAKMNQIDELRKEIDLINQNLLSTLNLRQLNVIKIIRLKQSLGMSLRDPGREEKMLNRVISTNQGPISAETVRDVLMAIFRHTLQDINI